MWIEGGFLPRWTQDDLLDFCKKTLKWKNAALIVFTHDANTDRFEVTRDPELAKSLKIVWNSTGTVGTQGQTLTYSDNPEATAQTFKAEWNRKQGQMIQLGPALIKGVNSSFSGGLGGESRVTASGRAVITPTKSLMRELNTKEKMLVLVNWEPLLKSLEADAQMRLLTSKTYFAKVGINAIHPELVILLNDCQNYQLEILRRMRKPQATDFFLLSPNGKKMVEKVGLSDQVVENLRKTLVTGVRDKVIEIVRMYDGWNPQDNNQVPPPLSPGSPEHTSQVLIPPLMILADQALAPRTHAREATQERR